MCVVSPLFASLFIPLVAREPVPSPRPHIVLLLADDLESDYKQDRLSLMPHLRTRVAERGASFVNHVAPTPQCGPSRAALLQGRWPHNTGYRTHRDRASYKSYARVENDTLGTWLTRAGYYTAYLGKVVNGFERRPPSGWRHFGGFISPYVYYATTQYNITAGAGQTGPRTLVHTGVHQADVLAAQTVAHMRAAVAEGSPFFVHLSPAMPHSGPCYPRSSPNYTRDDPGEEYTLACPPGRPPDDARTPGICPFITSPCPSLRRRRDVNSSTRNPRVPSWNELTLGLLSPPERRILAQCRPMGGWVASRQDIAYRNRTASAVDLDDLLGAVLDGAEALGIAHNLWLFFTSDNGYHLGEQRREYGKGTPYLVDTLVPLYVRGPGVPAGVLRTHATTHIDLAATIVDLARAHPFRSGSPPLDGKSMVGALGARPESARAWRKYQFSESAAQWRSGVGGGWWKLRFPFRNNGSEVHWWCAGPGFGPFAVGTPGAFFLGEDPWEQSNRAGSTPRATVEGNLLVETALPLAAGLAACKGSACNRAPRVAPDPTQPLPCYLRTSFTFP